MLDIKLLSSRLTRIERRQPSKTLQPYVREYRSARLEPCDRQLRFPLIARTQQSMGFYVGGPCWMTNPASSGFEEIPDSVVAGSRTGWSGEVILTGPVLLFTIEFQPGAIVDLFGLRASDLTDRALSAEFVLGAKLRRLKEQLRQSERCIERAEILDRLLLEHATAAPSTITRIAGQMITSGGRAPLGALAGQSGLSQRQFERRFQAAIGMNPKQFARIARFERVTTQMGVCRTEPKWAELAAGAGYYDQAHMHRDFRVLAGNTPRRLWHRYVAGDPRNG